MILSRTSIAVALRRSGKSFATQEEIEARIATQEDMGTQIATEEDMEARFSPKQIEPAQE